MVLVNPRYTARVESGVHEAGLLARGERFCWVNMSWQMCGRYFRNEWVRLD